MDPAGHETVLYRFTGGTDGNTPIGGVIADSAGNLYGTTYNGGTAGLGGGGVVYKLDTSGHETVLYNFTSGTDGGAPNAGLTMDAAGNLYGTTLYGGVMGPSGIQQGLVYKLDTSGRETVLYTFTGGLDGGQPSFGVIRDAQGNLYGTASVGGSGGQGVVYKIDGDGNETVLYNFTGGADGGNPGYGLIEDSAGNLYGTTSVSGNSLDGGVLFKLTPAP